MSLLASEDIARRVSAALEAVVAADAEAPRTKISLATDADDDDWVVGSVQLDPDVEAPTLPVATPDWAARSVPGPRKSRLRLTIAAGLLVLAALGVWAALASRSSERHEVGGIVPPATEASSIGGTTLRGTFTVWNGGTATDPCASVRSGAEPIEGDSIRLRGTDGGRLIMGALGSGSPTAARTGCSFPFVLRNVPSADKYLIAVSGQSSMILSHEQLAAAHWHLSMTLGSPSAG